MNYTALELPMGGAKASGLGSRHGAGGIRKYCQQQALLVSRLHPKKDLHMYPYNAKTTGRLTKLFRFLYGRGEARLAAPRHADGERAAMRSLMRRRKSSPRRSGAKRSCGSRHPLG